MRDLGRIVVQIPARGGSKRVPAKNLRYLAGRPLLAYAVEAAIASGVSPEVVVNTDSPVLGALAEELGAEVYRRSPALASDTATGDEFTEDFIRNAAPQTLVMVSPVCPLVAPADIQEALRLFRESSCDTLISCEETQMQVFVRGRPVNIDPSLPLAPTQENPRVQVLNWAVTVWDAPAFMANFAATGSAYLGRERLLSPIPHDRCVKISSEADFRLAELLLTARSGQHPAREPTYWSPGRETGHERKG